MSIRTCDAASHDDLEKAIADASVPVLLRGLAADWPAVHMDDPALKAYLAGFDQGEPVTAMCGEAGTGGRLFYDESMTGFNFRYERLRLSEALGRLAAAGSEPDGGSLYVGSTNIDHWLPGFRDANDLPLAHLGPLASIWIGGRSRVAAHYDFPANVACVVAGRRRFTLFPPDQLPNLYVGPVDLTPAGQPISLVDLHDPDFERFPRFRAALEVAEAVELDPGDALYVPSMWWHHVEAQGAFNVLVNYWWRDTPAWMGPPLAALQHALLALRDLPAAQRADWQRLFDYYVFNADDEHVAHIPEHARGVLGPIDEETARGLRQMLRARLL